MKAETQIQRDVSNALNNLMWRGRRACFVSRQMVGTFRALYSPDIVSVGLVGIADLGGFLCTGQALEAETKTFKGKLEKEQKAFRALCREMNVLHLVPRSPEEAANAVLSHLEAHPGAF